MDDYEKNLRAQGSKYIEEYIEERKRDLPDYAHAELEGYVAMLDRELDSSEEEKQKDDAHDEFVKNMSPEGKQAVELVFGTLNQGAHYMYAIALKDEANGIPGATAFRKKLEPLVEKYQQEKKEEEDGT